MTAFLLGAGLGTRLRPLTAVLPKPLIPVCNRPLATWAFDHLRAHGFDRFVINTHWLHERWAEAFPEGTYRGLPLHFRHEPEILETAGGLRNVADLLRSETTLVYNGDILTDLPLAPALRHHRQSGNEVTLVLRSGGGPRQVGLAEGSGRLTAIHSAPVEGAFLFTGIYLVEPSFLARIPAGQKIGVVPIFRQMIAAGEAIGGLVIDDGHWWDLGTREQYLAVHRHFAAAGGGAPWIHPEAVIGAGARLTGACAVGAGARVGDGAHLHDSILWPGAEAPAGVEWSETILPR